jgi:hypothetical protein
LFICPVIQLFYQCDLGEVSLKKTNTHLLAHLQAAQPTAKAKACKRASKSATRKRILKFFPDTQIKKIKTRDTQATTDSSEMTADKKIFHSGQTLHRWTARQQPTTACRQWRGQGNLNSSAFYLPLYRVTVS